MEFELASLRLDIEFALKDAKTGRKLAEAEVTLDEQELYKHKTMFHEIALKDKQDASLLFSVKAMDWGGEYDLYYWGYKSPFDTSFGSVTVPKLYVPPKPQANHTIVNVKLCRNFGMVVFNNGSSEDEIIVCKRSDEPEVLNEVLSDRVNLRDGSNLLQIATGAHHLLMSSLDSSGIKISAIGSNECGQCGISNQDKCTTWSEITDLSSNSLLNIYAGGGHNGKTNNEKVGNSGSSFALRGSNAFGQLGLGDKIDRHSPTSVPINENVRKIAIGNSHTLVLLEDRTMRSFGDNSQGQLGNPQSKECKERLTITEGPYILDVDDVDVYADCNIAIGKGKVFTWGGGVSTPKLVREISARGRVITSVSCGDHCYYAVDNEGKLYAWGRNSKGELGLNHREHADTPQIITELLGKRVSHVFCAEGHAAALVSRNTPTVTRRSEEKPKPIRRNSTPPRPDKSSPRKTCKTQ
ncbi:E3 ubiquitin-protein ligase HERC [Acrasis kona]|uniref:E3 ubiquitin-protein ligase HERC n=1 Tax=Acrasis kona TaxID=1008807 RepID=A0AAW2YNM5_9EUKA